MLVKDAMTRCAETIGAHETLEAAARKMREFGIGALAVCDADERPIGLVTDRDIVVRGIAQGEDPILADVRTVMTPQLICCSENDDLAGAARLMADRAVRRIAVIDAAEQLVGLLSVDDIALFSRVLAGDVIEHARMPEHSVAGAVWPWRE